LEVSKEKNQAAELSAFIKKNQLWGSLEIRYKNQSSTHLIIEEQFTRG
jgi:hypothetical protein